MRAAKISLATAFQTVASSQMSLLKSFWHPSPPSRSSAPPPTGQQDQAAGGIPRIVPPRHIHFQARPQCAPHPALTTTTHRSHPYATVVSRQSTLQLHAKRKCLCTPPYLSSPPLLRCVYHSYPSYLSAVYDAELGALRHLEDAPQEGVAAPAEAAADSSFLGPDLPAEARSAEHLNAFCASCWGFKPCRCVSGRRA